MKAGLVAVVALVFAAWIASASADDDAPVAAPTPTATDDGATEGSAYAGDHDYWTKTLPLHPKVVHIPIALCIVMPIVVLFLGVGVWRGWFSPSVWALAALLQCIQLGGALVALRSGHADEKVIEGYASDEAIHRHEEAAEVFTYATGATALLLGATWALRRRGKVAAGLAVASFAATCGVAYAGYVVGDAGGRLVYISGAADAHK